MKPVQQRLSEVGPGPWIPLDFRINDFGVGIGVNLSDPDGIIYSIQHTFDPVFVPVDVVITRTGTTCVVVFREPHAHSVGDSIIVTGVRQQNPNTADISGTFDIATVANEFTLQYETLATADVSTKAKASVLAVYNHDSIVNIEDLNSNGGYILPPSAIRLNLHDYSGGIATANLIFLAK